MITRYSVKTSLLVLAFSIKSVGVFGQEIQLKPGVTISVDGIKTDGEWADAESKDIGIGDGLRAKVFYKHDGKNFLFAFENFYKLHEEGLDRFPEVILDLDYTQGKAWNDNDWWFHTSYGACRSQGTPNDYDLCTRSPGQWTTNLYTNDKIPAFVEMLIPFESLKFLPKDRARIGIAFNVTDTFAVWNFWPVMADMMHPETWATGVIILE